MDLAGPSELLKPCPTESASLPVRPFRPESLPRSSLLAARLAVTDVKEVIQVLLGSTSSSLDLSLETFMEITLLVFLTPLLHVLTTPRLLSIHLALLSQILQCAPENVTQVTARLTIRTRPSELLLTLSLELLKL